MRTQINPIAVGWGIGECCPLHVAGIQSDSKDPFTAPVGGGVVLGLRMKSLDVGVPGRSQAGIEKRCHSPLLGLGYTD